MQELITELENYKPTNKNKKRSRSEVLNNTKRFLNGRDLIIKSFEDCTFSLSKKPLYKKQAEEEEEKKRKVVLKEFTDFIIEYGTGGINKKLYTKYFGNKVPTEMVKDLVNSDKEENNSLVTSIRNRLSDLVEEV